MDAVTRDRFDPDGHLAAALGREPTDDELLLWAGMPTDRRQKAIARIAVLRRWVEEPGELTAAEAASQADVAVSRWYELAAAWKTAPNVAAVGTFAKRPGKRGPRLDSKAVNIIQSVLPELVMVDPNAKVATLVAQLQADKRIQGHALPHLNTLRAMVEREKRRLKAEKQVGTRPGFDASACELLRDDGDHHVIFAVVDRTSGLILGFDVGRLEESRSAYARAAKDALTRLSRPDMPPLPWADSTARFDVIVGTDLEAWQGLLARYEADPAGPAFGLVETERRFGRYLKLAAGGTIGGLSLHPSRTGVRGKGTGGLTFSDSDAVAAIELEVGRHNAAVIAANVATGSARPAPDTIGVLEFIARG
jgi:hypothetical protein